MPGFATTFEACPPAGDADRRVGIALAKHKSGDLRGASRIYRDVLRDNPKHVDALHYLGLIAQQTGASGEAVRLLENARLLNPRDPRVHNHLGQVLLALGKAREALRSFEAAVAADPRHVDSLDSLANALRMSGRAREAVALYKKALAVDPNAARSAYNLANTLRDMGAAEEARKWFERAVEIAPSIYQASFNLAVLLEEQGRFEGAARHYRKTLEHCPGHAKAIANLLALRSPPAEPGVAEAAQKLLRRVEGDSEDALKLHHGLGKYLDRRGEFTEAFAHFAHAKEILRRKQGPFDEESVRRYFDGVVETFSADYLRTVTGGSRSTRPIFIVGLPRSGTTLAEQILASHPLVFGAGELQAIPDMLRSLRPAYPAGFGSKTAADLAVLADGYLESIGRLAPDETGKVTDKLPVNFTHLGLITTLFPEARIVYCRRHPLDIAMSCYVELFQMSRDFTTDLLDFGMYFLQHERLMRHWQAVLPRPVYELRYERLVGNPEQQVRALLSYCGLEWDDACADHASTRRRVQTPSRWQVRQPIYRSSVGRWKNYAAQLEPLRTMLAPSIARYEAARTLAMDGEKPC